jgi:competence protein ComGC
MNPRKAKTLIAVLIVVVIISLTMKLILLGRLHRTTEQAEKWKKAHERLALKQLFLEKQHTLCKRTVSSLALLRENEVFLKEY